MRRGGLIIALAKLIAGRLDVQRCASLPTRTAARAAAVSGRASLDVVADLRAEKRKLTQLDIVRGEAAWCHPDVQTLARRKLLRALRVALPLCVWRCRVKRSAQIGRSSPTDHAERVCRRGRAGERRWEVRRARFTQRRVYCTKYAGHRAGRGGHVHARRDASRQQSPPKSLEGATKNVGHALRALAAAPRRILPWNTSSSETEEGLRLWATELEVGLTRLAAGHALHICVAGCDDRRASYCWLPQPRALASRRRPSRRFQVL